jgi:hypothetical protein
MAHHILTMILEEKPSHLGSAASLVWTVHQGLTREFSGACFWMFETPRSRLYGVSSLPLLPIPTLPLAQNCNQEKNSPCYHSSVRNKSIPSTKDHPLDVLITCWEHRRTEFLQLRRSESLSSAIQEPWDCEQGQWDVRKLLFLFWILLIWGWPLAGCHYISDTVETS